MQRTSFIWVSLVSYYLIYAHIYIYIMASLSHVFFSTGLDNHDWVLGSCTLLGLSLWFWAQPVQHPYWDSSPRSISVSVHMSFDVSCPKNLQSMCAFLRMAQNHSCQFKNGQMIWNEWLGYLRPSGKSWTARRETHLSPGIAEPEKKGCIHVICGFP